MTPWRPRVNFLDCLAGQGNSERSRTMSDRSPRATLAVSLVFAFHAGVSMATAEPDVPASSHHPAQSPSEARQPTPVTPGHERTTPGRSPHPADSGISDSRNRAQDTSKTPQEPQATGVGDAGPPPVRGAPDETLADGADNDEVEAEAASGAGASGDAASPPSDTVLRIATWDSAYNKAQQRALFRTFEAETGTELDVASHGGDLQSITAAKVRARQWDLIELDAQTAQRGCDEGWLSEISAGDLPPSVEGDPPRADYLPGAVMRCAVGSAAWSSVVVYDRRADFDTAPDRLEDLFDLERFPGQRALPRQAPYLLEAALMAEGVAPANVYEVLATRSGQDRAFAKLSAIRHAIVWWDSAADALATFPARKPSGLENVVMGMAFNGRIFTSAVREQPSLRIVWNGQMYRFNYWAIPESTSNRQAALDLLRHVSVPERQARVAQMFPYGPARRSALPLVGRHAEIEIDMADFVPTVPRHMEGALRFNAAWWAERGGPIKTRFADWLARPTPRVPLNQLVPPVPEKARRATHVTAQ